MDHWEKQDAIDGLVDALSDTARASADRIYTESAYCRDIDRVKLYADCLEFRIRMLLEDISFSSPGLFRELIGRHLRESPDVAA